MKKIWIGGSGLVFTALLCTMWLNQGCVGGIPPLSVMVLTATPTSTPAPTSTPVPTPSYPLCTNVTNPPYLIDDFEDGNSQVLANQCRNGYWFNYNDGTGGGVQTLSEAASPGVGYNGTGGSAHAIEVTTNSGFTNYGAGFGFDFINPSGPLSAGNYNAYGFHGIQFYGKSGLGAVIVSFSVPDYNVLLTNYATGGHGLNVTFSNSWQLYQVSFATLSNMTVGGVGGNSYGTATVFDPSQLQQVEFQVGKSIASDVWVDNISFY